MDAYQLIKIGIEPLDALRAYGLALLLATITNQPVAIEDRGYIYSITGAPYDDGPAAPIIADILPGPQVTEFLQSSEQTQAIVDGLLTLLFTSPGPRILGMDDIRFVAADDPDRLSAIYEKIQAYRKRILNTVRKANLSAIIAPYSAYPPPLPVLIRGTVSSLKLPMVIAGQIGYGLRSPSSDGMICKRVNVTMQGERFGVLLAIIGATRFLRAQRVTQKYVLLTVPLIQTATVHADTIRPVERRADQSSRQCLAIHALSQVLHPPDKTGTWQGIAYQRLQTQGSQQSISVDRGEVSLAWLLTIQHARPALVRVWLRTLRAEQRTISIEQSLLIDVILQRSGAAWIQHLRDSALTSYEPLAYGTNNVQEVTAFMTQTPETMALTAMLGQDQGTLRFGRALRQLGRNNLAMLRDVHAALDHVHSTEALLSVLTTITLESELMFDRRDFIVVPNEDDLELLLQDCACYGVAMVAKLIIILSVLRYPRTHTPDTMPIATLEA